MLIMNCIRMYPENNEISKTTCFQWKQDDIRDTVEILLHIQNSGKPFNKSP